MLPPRHRQVALGAAHLLLVPVHRELLHGVSALDLRLPPLAGACGAPQGDALGVAAVDEQLRADRGRIDQVLVWRHVLSMSACWMGSVHCASCTVAGVLCTRAR